MQLGSIEVRMMWAEVTALPLARRLETRRPRCGTSPAQHPASALGVEAGCLGGSGADQVEDCPRALSEGSRITFDLASVQVRSADRMPDGRRALTAQVGVERIRAAGTDALANKRRDLTQQQGSGRRGHATAGDQHPSPPRRCRCGENIAEKVGFALNLTPCAPDFA